ncbi:MAG: hypothetical protein KC910_28030 [Candidatus Eremiobacteraeota bacterium]|nr:hypothetical protein [Candidatus Eremiobacteraeota bacterium]
MINPIHNVGQIGSGPIINRAAEKTFQNLGTGSHDSYAPGLETHVEDLAVDYLTQWLENPDGVTSAGPQTVTANFAPEPSVKPEVTTTMSYGGNFNPELPPGMTQFQIDWQIAGEHNKG